MKRPPTWLPLLAVLPLAACSEPATTTSTWNEIPLADLDATQQSMFDRAKASAGSVVKTLVGELTAKMSAEGPVAAMEHCRLRAPEVMAETTSAMDGVRIGRTSHKLRNPSNGAPEGELHVLLPIPIQPPCLVCHGDPETMTEDPQQELLANYPEDEATGFATEDLRGWFWVEVPPATE
ncbi:MAG: c-type heme family protein [Planctomycetota bacterium]